MNELTSGESRLITLRDTWNEYSKFRKIKKSTAVAYERNLRTYLESWLDRPVVALTKGDVLSKHSEISEKYSGDTANFALRIARALITFAIYRWDLDIPHNPVKVLSNLRAWNKQKHRTGHLTENLYRPWFLAVEKEMDTTREYLKFMLLTGMRRGETAELKWSNVDLKNGCFHAEDTKNGEDLNLPLASYQWQMLQHRRQRYPKDHYVFSNTVGKPFELQKYIVFRIACQVGQKIDCHDLRRSFITIGDSLDIPLHIIKRLANHKEPGDVTLRYIQSSPHRLRPPSEKICEKIVELWMRE